MIRLPSDLPLTLIGPWKKGQLIQEPIMNGPHSFIPEKKKYFSDPQGDFFAIWMSDIWVILEILFQWIYRWEELKIALETIEISKLSRESPPDPPLVWWGPQALLSHGPFPPTKKCLIPPWSHSEWRHIMVLITNRFLKFTSKFPLVSELFDEEKKNSCYLP